MYGIQFIIVTDCDRFRLTLSKQVVNPRSSRWAMFLQQYNYEICHRSNKGMQHVDALSRCHNNNVLVIEGNTLERTLAVRKNQNDEICKIRDKLEIEEDKFFATYDRLLSRKDKEGKLLFYVLCSMEANVILTCHVCVYKLVENISLIYWFPLMRTKVKEYIANCLKCIEFSSNGVKKEGYLHSLQKGDKPFHT